MDLHTRKLVKAPERQNLTNVNDIAKREFRGMAFQSDLFTKHYQISLFSLKGAMAIKFSLTARDTKQRFPIERGSRLRLRS